jgi:hypothetical protein
MKAALAWLARLYCLEIPLNVGILYNNGYPRESFLPAMRQENPRREKINEIKEL